MVIIKCKVILCIVFYLCFPYTSSINMSSCKFLGIKVKNNTEDINKLIVKGLEDLLKDNTINNFQRFTFVIIICKYLKNNWFGVFF